MVKLLLDEQTELMARKFRERECAEKAIEVLEALLPAGIHSLQDA